MDFPDAFPDEDFDYMVKQWRTAGFDLDYNTKLIPREQLKYARVVDFPQPGVIRMVASYSLEGGVWLMFIPPKGWRQS